MSAGHRPPPAGRGPTTAKAKGGFVWEKGEGSRSAFCGSRDVYSTRSWANIARGGNREVMVDSVVSADELDRIKAMFSETLVFPEEEIEAARNEWRGKSLISKFLCRKFPLEFVVKALMYRWNPRGDVEIIPLLNGFFLFRFANGDDLHKVRSGGPVVVGGAVLALEEWRGNFKPNRDDISKATIWMRLPGLPAEFWKRNFVLAIASRAGRPIEVDVCTKNMARGKFARVCIEVDLLQPLVAGTPVGPAHDQIFQEFVYEGIDRYCFRCGVIGHAVHECKHNVKEAKLRIAKVVSGDGTVLGDDDCSRDGDASIGDGGGRGIFIPSSQAGTRIHEKKGGG